MGDRQEVDKNGDWQKTGKKLAEDWDLLQNIDLYQVVVVSL